MSNAIGYKGILGIAKQTAYDTAVAATEKVPFLSESLKNTPEYVNHEYLCGKAALKDIQQVFVPAGGSIEAVVPYTALSDGDLISSTMLIAAAMGKCTWDTTGAVNKITLADDIASMLTLGVAKGLAADVMEAVGAIINTMTLSASANDQLKVSIETLAGTVLNGTTTNTKTSLEALACASLDLMTYNQMTFRIGTHASALATTDAVGISSFEVTINNNLTSGEQSSPDDTSGHEDPNMQIQPIRNGFRESGLTIEIPRYIANTFIAWKEDEEDLQADIVFASGTNYLKILLPHLRVTDTSEPVSGPAALKQTVTFKLLEYIDSSDIAFADASTDNGEVWIETKDARTATIL